METNLRTGRKFPTAAIFIPTNQEKYGRGNISRSVAFRVPLQTFGWRVVVNPPPYQRFDLVILDDPEGRDFAGYSWDRAITFPDITREKFSNLPRGFSLWVVDYLNPVPLPNEWSWKIPTITLFGFQYTPLLQTIRMYKWLPLPSKDIVSVSFGQSKKGLKEAEELCNYLETTEEVICPQDEVNYSFFQLLSTCKASVVSGGLTLLESVCIGAPTILLMEDYQDLNSYQRKLWADGKIFVGYKSKPSWLSSVIGKGFKNFPTLQPYEIDGLGIYRIIEAMELSHTAV